MQGPLCSEVRQQLSGEALGETTSDPAGGDIKQHGHFQRADSSSSECGTRSCLQDPGILLFSCFKQKREAGEKARCINLPAAEVNSLSLTPGLHMVEGRTEVHKVSSNLHPIISR